MERLTKRIVDSLVVFTQGRYRDTIPAEMDNDDIRMVLKKLEDYEDTEEQGLLLRLPCKVGDEFWVIAYRDNKMTHVKCTGYTIQVDEVNKINHSYIWIDSIENPNNFWKLGFKEFENQCFRTREEAEAALKEMKGE